MAGPPGSVSMTSALNLQAVTPAGKEVDVLACADARSGVKAPKPSAISIQPSERLSITTPACRCVDDPMPTAMC